MKFKKSIACLLAGTTFLSLLPGVSAGQTKTYTAKKTKSNSKVLPWVTLGCNGLLLVVGAKFLFGSNCKKPPQPQPTPQQTGPAELKIEFTMQELKDASKDKRFKWKDYGYVVNGRNVIISLPDLEDSGTVTELQKHNKIGEYDLTRSFLARTVFEDVMRSLPLKIEQFLMSSDRTLSTNFMKITKAAPHSPAKLKNRLNNASRLQDLSIYTEKFIRIMEGKLPLKKPTTTGK